jgi:hypothetical protein
MILTYDEIHYYRALLTLSSNTLACMFDLGRSLAFFSPLGSISLIQPPFSNPCNSHGHKCVEILRRCSRPSRASGMNPVHPRGSYSPNLTSIWTPIQGCPHIPPLECPTYESTIKPAVSHYTRASVFFLSNVR